MLEFRDLLSCAIFILTYAGEPADAVLTSYPTDTEAVVGQTVRLRCSTSDRYYVLWEHTPVGAANYDYVFFSGRIVKPYHERHKIEGNSSAGEYHLVITNVQSSDAGLYGCVDQAGHGDRREAQLIVLVPQPRCNTSDDVVGENPCHVPEEQVKIQCEIDYSGNRPPTIECGVKDDFTITATTSPTEIYKKKATYDLTSNVNPMSLKDSTLICQTSQSKIISNDFHTKLLYMEKEPSIRTLGRPEHLICVFESSLQCRYSWLHALSNMGAFVDGDVILGNRSGLYRCKVVCSLHDKPCIVFSQSMKIPEEENTAAQSGTQTHVIILATVCTVVSVIIISLILGLYIHRKRKSKTPNKSYADTPKDNQEKFHSESLNETQKSPSEEPLLESFPEKV